MKKIIPLRGYCLIETMNEEKSEAGLYRPESSKDKPSKGKVLAVGEPSADLMEKVGGPRAIEDYRAIQDKVVFFHRWSAHDLPDHKNQVLIKFDDIQGIDG